MAANYGLLILGAGLLIGLLLFGGTIITVATGLFAQINVGIADLFKSIGGNSTNPSPSPSSSPTATPTPTVSPTPTSGGSITATAWYAFTIHFSDGSSQDLNMNPTFSIFPLSITFQGKTVSSIDIFIRLKCTGANMGSWTAVSSQHIELYLKPSQTPETSSTGSFTKSGSSWVSGSTQSIQDTQADSLNIIMASIGTGNWLLQTTGTVTLTMSVNGQSQQYNCNMGAGGIDLSNNGALSIFSIAGSNLQTYPLTRTR